MLPTRTAATIAATIAAPASQPIAEVGRRRPAAAIAAKSDSSAMTIASATRNLMLAVPKSAWSSGWRRICGSSFI
jgi:hypothetical protein